MRVAIVGCRKVPDFVDVDYVICHIPYNCTEIISGGADGIDTLARLAAQKLDLPIREFLPDYQTYGRRAPLIRNEQIVEAADYVVALWDGHSHGTAHTVDLCFRKHVPIRVYVMKHPLEAQPKIPL